MIFFSTKIIRYAFFLLLQSLERMIEFVIGTYFRSRKIN